MKIPNITFSDGAKIPQIGLGTWQLRGSLCENAVRKALELGYRHIDTAEIYRNEDEIGQVIENFDRKKLFITSKVFPFHLSYEGILNSCEKSLEKLKTDYLDLYLIHWPRRNKEMNYLNAFKELQETGKIKSFGVSNFTIHHLQDMIPFAKKLGLKIVENQVEFHPLLYQKELLEFCNKNKIQITAYSPLARGRVFENPILNKIAEKYNKTAGQISLRWLFEKKLVIIPKASSQDHLKENLKILDFKLKKSDREEIDNLTERVRAVNFPFISDFNY